MQKKCLYIWDYWPIYWYQNFLSNQPQNSSISQTFILIYRISNALTLVKQEVSTHYSHLTLNLNLVLSDMWLKGQLRMFNISNYPNNALPAVFSSLSCNFTFAELTKAPQSQSTSSSKWKNQLHTSVSARYLLGFISAGVSLLSFLQVTGWLTPPSHSRWPLNSSLTRPRPFPSHPIPTWSPSRSNQKVDWMWPSPSGCWCTARYEKVSLGNKFQFPVLLTFSFLQLVQLWCQKEII